MLASSDPGGSELASSDPWGSELASSDPWGSELAEAGPEPDTPNLMSDQVLKAHLLSLRWLQGDSKTGVEAIFFVLQGHS